MLLKFLLLLLIISISYAGMDMRDTDGMLKRMYEKSSKVGERKNGQFSAIISHTTKVNKDTKTITKDVTDEIPTNKQKIQSDSKNELIWANNSKRYINKKKYEIVLKEYIELKHPKKVALYEAKLQKDADAKVKKIKEQRKKLQRERKAKELLKKKKRVAAEKRLLKEKEIQLKAESKDKKVTKESKKTKKSLDKKIKIKKPKKLTRDGSFVIASNHLMWQDNEDVKTTKLNWSNARKHCEDLVIGSYDDWRLPAKEELAGIVDKKKKPTINKKFQNVKADYYWTKSDYKNSKYYAWAVSFSLGELESNSKDKHSLVRCTRDRK